MKLPTQPNQYDRNLEQQRSGELEREIQRILTELSRLRALIDDHEARIVVLEP
jgi:hypothetical protein